MMLKQERYVLDIGLMKQIIKKVEKELESIKDVENKDRPHQIIVHIDNGDSYTVYLNDINNVVEWTIETEYVFTKPFKPPF